MGTLDLLTKALDMKKQGEWARLLGLSDAAFSMAKKRHRLSPTIAGKLAHAMGEDERQWIAIAGLEAEPPSQDRDMLLTRLTSTTKTLKMAADTVLKS